LADVARPGIGQHDGLHVRRKALERLAVLARENIEEVAREQHDVAIPFA